MSSHVFIWLQIRNDKRTAILVQSASRGKKLVVVYRPNTGAQTKQETIEDIKKKYKKVRNRVRGREGGREGGRKETDVFTCCIMPLRVKQRHMDKYSY